ncbi:hypothetical protein ACJRO7_032207 [Eucalyptus globulus]|uniref:Uncharacterized protein n=1 Tax=Eucalyptus globulus TaxID=34317 RepID=A0ABD3JKH6_EUCGL
MESAKTIPTYALTYVAASLLQPYLRLHRREAPSPLCNCTCQTLNDCAGQSICVNGKCNDEPDLGTYIWTAPVSPPSIVPPPLSSIRSPPPSRSPPVTSSTLAILRNNDFCQGGDRRGPSMTCTIRKSKPIIVLSTGCSSGSRCSKMINIKIYQNRKDWKG